MKKLIAILTKALSLSFTGFSQAVQPLWAWQNNFNAGITDIVYDNDFLYTCGNFSTAPFVLGNVNLVNLGSNDALVMRSGNLIWARRIAGSASDIATSICINASGEVVVAGYSNSGTLNLEGNIFTSNGSNDIFVARFDANGSYISANLLGTAASETCTDICTDLQNNFYVAGTGGLTKYSVSGNFEWQRSVPVSRVFYSAIDNNVVLVGVFTSTLSVANFSITALGPYSDLFTLKLTLTDTPLFLLNITNLPYTETQMQACLNEQSGNLYVGERHMGFSLNEYLYVREITAAGVVTNQGVFLGGDQEAFIELYSMSAKDSLLSFHARFYGQQNFLYSLNTFQPIITYNMNNVQQNIRFQCIRGINELYICKEGSNSLGKISTSVLTGTPSYQILHTCSGTSTTISGNITGGAPPLTYSWLPVTGLNDTTTNTVSFTPVNNISYTLTVTDAIGQVAKDTFDIIVDTLIPPANITTQYPVLCDTMLLYANNGVPGVWYYVIGNSWYTPPGGFGNYGLTQKVIQQGRYMYSANNGCGYRYDSIDVAVAASSAMASICANEAPYIWNGQSIDSTGTYIANFTTANGCDSIATLNLTISPCIFCVANFTINYSPFVNSLTESQTWIVTSGNVLILAGDKVKLDVHTDSYVQLNPVFKVDSGAVFVAQAYNCCTAGAPQIPNAKVFNGDATGANAEIVLYPNPTSGLIHKQHDEKLKGIQIFDMVGKPVIHQKCNGETETDIDLSHLPNGVYHVNAAGYNSIKVVKNN